MVLARMPMSGQAFTIPPRFVELTADPHGGGIWYTGPQAIRYNGEVHFTWVRGDNGHGEIASVHDSTGVVSDITDFRNIQIDDHANASLTILSDGRIMPTYSAHGGGGQYHRIGTSAEDISAFNAEVNIDSTLGGSSYTYNQTVKLANGHIYRFYREGHSSTTAVWQYTVSTDDGATWSAPVTLLSEPSEAPYLKVIRNGPDRIDLASTDKAPNAPGVTQISVFAGYMIPSAGTFHQSDGTAITLPLTSANMTLVAEGVTAPRALEDIAIGTDGQPRIVSTRYVNVATDHRYDYHRWTGSAWVTNQMALAGAGELESSGWYSGGVAIDRLNANIVRASINDGSQYEMHRFLTGDGGQTWRDDAITIDSLTKQIRPTSVQDPVSGGFRCMWMNASVYTAYTTWSAGIRGTRF